MKKLLTIALCALFAIHAAEARTLYVNAKAKNNKGNGLSVKKAKKTIQAAINIARKGDTILVYPGTYAPIKTNNKKIEIVAVKGASKTKILKPKKANRKVALAQLGKSYTRYVGADRQKISSSIWTKGSNSVLRGFVLDGLNRTVGSDGELIGVSGGVLRQCTIRNLGRRLADTFGGYDHYETASAAVNSTLVGCTIKNNFGYLAPAETAAANLISGRTETTGSKFQRCKIFGNQTWCGIEYGQLFNSLLYGNVINDPNGLFKRSKLLNCTVSNNLVEEGDSSDVLLAYKSRFKNCIVYGNYSRPSWQKTIGYTYYYDNICLGYCGVDQTTFEVLDDDTDDAGTVTVTEETLGNYWPGWTKVANKITAPAGKRKTDLIVSEKCNTLVRTDAGGTYPRFANKYENDYHLVVKSPFIDAGRLTAAEKKKIGTKDLDGKKRINGKYVDRGCYEY